MKNFLVLTVTALLLLAVFSQPAKCTAASYEFSLDPQACYIPTKVIFNFPTTSDVSLTDVSTVSQTPTGYSYEGSPTMFTFIAKEVDIYTFSLLIHYENATAANETRTALISLWSGTLQPGGAAVTSTEQDFVIHIRLSLTQQPTIPTPQEIAQAGFHFMEQSFVEMFDKLTVQNLQIADLSFKVTVLSLVMMVFACVAVFFALVAYKEKRRGST